MQDTKHGDLVRPDPIENQVGAMYTASDTVRLVASNQREAFRHIDELQALGPELLYEGDGAPWVVTGDTVADGFQIGRSYRRYPEFHSSAFAIA